MGNSDISNRIFNYLGCYFCNYCNGYISFFEWIFSACSNITLLDLSDYNSPALKQLQGAASGTYNHYIAVPNIAEQVAYSTGANIKNFFQYILYIILIYFEKYFF